MPTTAYAALLATNLRIARAAAALSQADIGERMRALGFPTWLRQTMSTVEKGKRRVTAEEVAALALCMETTAARLMMPRPDDNGGPIVEFPSGLVIHSRRIIANDHSVQWDGNVPHVVQADPRNVRTQAEHMIAGLSEQLSWAEQFGRGSEDPS